MKKRILTWLLAISMLGSLLTVPAGAAAVTKFSDVSDSYTATAVETLRLMGVLFGSYPAAKASKLQPVEALRAD